MDEGLDYVQCVKKSNLCDSEFFGAVMKSREAYECVLSILLDDRGLKLKTVHVENPVYNDKGQRSIRLDTYAVDANERQINTEMQNDTAHDDMMRRSRYYQSLMDSHTLKAGPNRYKDMRDTIIIFITQEDMFGKDAAEYVCRPELEPHADITVSDGTERRFFNMQSFNGREELVSLLQYIKETDINNPCVTSKDERLLRLDKIVNEVKQSEEWEETSMSIYGKGRQEGKQEGMQEGVQKSIITFIGNCTRMDMDQSQIESQLKEYMGLDQETARSYIEMYNNKNLQSV